MFAGLKRRTGHLLLVGVLWPWSAAAAVDYRVEASGVRVAGFEIERLAVQGGEAPTAEIHGLKHEVVGRIGSLFIACSDDSAACGSGALTLGPIGGGELEMEFRRASDEIRLRFGETSAELSWSGTDEARATIESASLDPFLALVPDGFGLASLSGSLDAEVRYTAGGIDGSATLSGGGFDTRDGRFAGAGLHIDLEASVEPAGRVRISAEWRGGEALLGPAYLPPPDPPVAFAVTGDIEAGQWHLPELSVAAGDRLAVKAGGRVEVADGRLVLERLEVGECRLDVAWLWSQGLESIAASKGWGELSPTGTLEGRGSWSDGELETARFELRSAGVRDEAGRIGLETLSGSAVWQRAGPELAVSLEWGDGSLYRLPLGETRIALRTGAEGHLRLEEPVRIPLLDGAFVVDRFEWRDWTTPQRELRFDAGLEPIGLAALTRALGWNEFGGRISGRFDGLRIAGGVAEVEGGLDISLFDGRATVRGLTIERPFGTSPALAADVELSRLDLELATRAFEFGRMEGLASGHLRGLRLLDWQLVQFDAWFETLEDSPERVITQQAVDTLSNLSGGGNAAISGLLLQWFDEFPYRKAGLGCRLSGNVCRMRGLSETEKGGYLILDGRGIPRLDIVGWQRRVDWPQMMEQLQGL